jgi:hypothetical protein
MAKSNSTGKKKPAGKPAIKKNISDKRSTARRKITSRKKTGLKKLTGNIVNIKHFDFEARVPSKVVPKGLKFEVFRRLRDSPKVDIAIEPSQGDYVVFHPMPGFTAGQKAMGQISVMALVYNKDNVTIDLDRVVVQHKKGSVLRSQTVYLPSDQLIIEPWYCWAWQNSRPYHEPGDVVFFEEPYPDKLILSFHFKGYSDPVKITKNLKPYNIALPLPFKSADLGKDEYFTGYSMHGGGDQVFAYDFSCQGFDKNGWYDVLPNKDYSKNENFRIWGKPVYAMADGVVMHFQKDILNNTVLDGSEENLEKQKNDYWGSYAFGGSGNHFYIKHGDFVALYAHLQKGSLTTKFAKTGAIVRKGDLLGKAGNSGNSSGPHLHVHLKKYVKMDKPEDGFFRPLIFSNGYVIGTADHPKPRSNPNWSKLNKQGIPGLEGKACFIWPSNTHPYCEYPTNWAEVCRIGVPESKFQEEFNKVWPCGYYPVWIDGYDSGGKTFFNMIFRKSENTQWVARHNMDKNGYQKEFNIWDEAGFRLININSYLLNGKVRYAAIWTNQHSVDWFAYHATPLSEHEKNFEKYANEGWVPVNVSCTLSGGKILVSAIWEKKNVGGFYLKPVMTLKQYKEAFKQFTDKEKFKLVYLDAYSIAGIPMLSGIWHRNAPGYSSWSAKHHLKSAEFDAEYGSLLNTGYLTKCVAGYRSGSSHRFEGIWNK